jgi:molybdopterin-guanine dinucleotide biosynthesis protein A
VFVAACDLPFIRAELVDYVAGWSSVQEAFVARCEEQRPRARIAVWEGRRQPLFGLYSASCRSALARSLREGRLEARSFLDEIDTTAVGITPDLDFYRPDLLLNVNSPADLPQSFLDESSVMQDR